MSNEDARRQRNELRVALRARRRDRAALVQRREENVHAVDERALADVSHQEGVLAYRLQRLGGDPYGNLDFEEM
jgi:hypothetical protein